MNQVLMTVVDSVPASIREDQSLSVVALFSGIGLLVSIGLIALGIDLGPAYI